MNDVSIDIETLGQRYNSPIISIGAVAFDRHTGKLGKQYYAEVDIKDSLRHGTPDGATVAWWVQQGTGPAKNLFVDTGRKVVLIEALRGLNDFLRDISANVCVWGNGSTFDISILEHAYDKAGNGLREHWQYWAVRDMRTIVDVAGFDKKTMPFAGAPHHALDDAAHQAKVIAECFRLIGGQRVGKKAAPPAPAPAPAANEDDDL